ncbi:hypothetical protein [Panacagrimonas sp.]|uniref:hypothetical protein n=1 Tax=Panacagrimonas sp. TaxID=2480088 RepID=UPI003B522574
MEPTWILHAGMAFAVLGFFVAAWYRYRRPVDLKRGDARRAPVIDADSSTSEGETRGPAAADRRRAPTL